MGVWERVCKVRYQGELRRFYILCGDNSAVLFNSHKGALIRLAILTDIKDILSEVSQRRL